MYLYASLCINLFMTCLPGLRYMFSFEVIHNNGGFVWSALDDFVWSNNSFKLSLNLNII